MDSVKVRQDRTIAENLLPAEKKWWSILKPKGGIKRQDESKDESSANGNETWQKTPRNR
jgi:hypothetical protein